MVQLTAHGTIPLTQPQQAKQPDPTPPSELPFLADIAFWYDAGLDAYSNDAGTVACTDGDGLAHWGNQGNIVEHQEPALQSTPASRPIWRASGTNSKPYVEFPASRDRVFEDLLTMTTGAGILGDINWNAMAAVVELPDNLVSASKFLWLFGSNNSNLGGKLARYIRGSVNPPNFHIVKSENRGGGFYQSIPNAFVVSTELLNGSRAWMTNNGFRFSRFGGTDNADPGGQNQARFMRGPNNSAAGGFFEGRLYEIIVWKDRLVFGEESQGQVMDYLLPKYGITPQIGSPAAWS